MTSAVGTRRSYAQIRFRLLGAAVSLALTGLVGPGSGALPGKSAADVVLPPADPQVASALDTSLLDSSSALATGAVGIKKIQHIVVIMQENRSFDHYFGTYPGANGIKMKDGQFVPCLKVPNQSYCIRPYHDKGPLDAGGAHHVPDAIADINGGKMDGFIKRALSQQHWQCTSTHDPHCTPGTRVPDIMGFKNRSDIPNYWAYADQFVLQDAMFVPNLSWSLPAHLAMVSGWVARGCKNGDPTTCTANFREPNWNHNRTKPNPDYAWTDLTWLLKQAGVSWAYYVANGSQPDCWDGDAICPQRSQSAKTPDMWNPLPFFDTVQQDGQVNNVKRLKAFYNAVCEQHAAAGQLDHSERHEQRAPAGTHLHRAGVRDRPRQRDHEVAGVGQHRDLHHVGRVGRLLRPRRAARRGRQRLRPARPRAGHQPVCEARLHRPADAELRRLPEVHRGSLPGRLAHRSGHGRAARPAADGARERRHRWATCGTTSTSRRPRGRRSS